MSNEIKCRIDVEAKAREFNVQVRYASLEVGVSGQLIKLDTKSGDDWEIVVNEEHSSNRQRFTIAHELGHYFLHRGSIDGTLEDNTFYRSEQVSG